MSWTVKWICFKQAFSFFLPLLAVQSVNPKRSQNANPKISCTGGNSCIFLWGGHHSLDMPVSASSWERMQISGSIADQLQLNAAWNLTISVKKQGQYMYLIWAFKSQKWQPPYSLSWAPTLSGSLNRLVCRITQKAFCKVQNYPKFYCTWLLEGSPTFWPDMILLHRLYDADGADVRHSYLWSYCVPILQHLCVLEASDPFQKKDF